MSLPQSKLFYIDSLPKCSPESLSNIKVQIRLVLVRVPTHFVDLTHNLGHNAKNSQFLCLGASGYISRLYLGPKLDLYFLFSV